MHAASRLRPPFFQRALSRGGILRAASPRSAFAAAARCRCLPRRFTPLPGAAYLRAVLMVHSSSRETEQPHTGWQAEKETAFWRDRNRPAPPWQRKEILCRV